MVWPLQLLIGPIAELMTGSSSGLSIANQKCLYCIVAKGIGTEPLSKKPSVIYPSIPIRVMHPGSCNNLDPIGDAFDYREDRLLNERL